MIIMMLLLLLLLLFPGSGEGCSPDRPNDPSCWRCAQQVALGSSHTCVLLDKGVVHCSGENDCGQLMLGQADQDDRKMLLPAMALSPMTIRSVGCGGHYTCALVVSELYNTVYCVGSAWSMSGPACSPRMYQRRNLLQTPPIQQLVVGPDKACVVHESPAVGLGVPIHCWTLLVADSTGPPGSLKSNVVPVPGTTNATALAIGVSKSCAILRNRTVVCWDDTYSSLAKVQGLSSVVRVAVGERYACAVVRPAQAVGTVWCWGKDKYGGFASNSSTAVRVRGLPGSVLDVVAGTAHVCALVRTASSIVNGGQVYCWGNNEYGVLGQGYTNGSTTNPKGSKVPLRVKGLANVTKLFGGYSGNCAVVAERPTFCWGSNYNGQLSTRPIGRSIVTLPTAMETSVLYLCA
jgi:alpha-tubulin suppressor-like RCC1 family protein